MKNLLRIILCVLIGPLVGLGLAGCDYSEVSLDWGMHQRNGSSPDALRVKRMSLTRLAEELDLTIIQQGSDMARLQNSANTVTIFPDPYGSVYVNGQRVAVDGRVETHGGALFVPPSLPAAIRKSMRQARVVASPPPAPAPVPQRWLGTVVLDAGHGGKDPGAMSPAGDREADIVLDVVREAATRLQDRGVKVLLTRDNDTFVELDDRVSFANRQRPELFLSVHVDAAGNLNACGFTVYVPKRTGEASASQNAGEALAQRLEAVTSVSRGVRRHDVNLRVLEQTRVPAVLVELGFISNAGECRLLLQPAYRQKLATALADAVAAHLEAR